MKIFENVAQLKLARLGTGQLVKTKGYYTANDGGGAEYIIVATGTGTDDGGSYLDLALNQAELVSSGDVNINQFGAVGDGLTDSSVQIQSTLDSGFKSIYFNKGLTYIARNLTVTGNGLHIYADGAVIKNPNGVNGQTILEVNGEGNSIFDLTVDGNNGNDAGGSIGDASFRGIELNGRNNKAIRCTAKSVGKLLTSGDQGGTNQVGVGFGGASDNPDKPNLFIDCLAYDNGNYGFNPRSNVSIIRGATWGNGTNGLGNRYSSNFHVNGTIIGVQYQGNPDTSSVGMTLDTESSGSADFQKISKNCSFKNMLIENNEAGSISSTYYAPIFENVYCKGDVLIQSTLPIVAPDIGTTTEVVLRGITIDGSFTALNIQNLKIDMLVQKEATSLAFLVDSVEKFYFNNIETYASLARLIRCGSVLGRGVVGTGQLDISTIPDLDISGVYMDGVTPVSDQKAIQLSSTQGQLTGKIKNYGYPISSSSGNSGMDLSGFEFENCGASDGSDQNACVNFKNTNGYVLNGLKFRGCTGRLLYAINMTGGSVVGFNANSACSGSVTIEGSSNDFMYQSNNLLGTGTIRIFAGASMGSTAYSNYKGASITVSAYPAGWS